MSLPDVEAGDRSSGAKRDLMPLRHNPNPGDVLFCRFDEHEFAPPEMTKRRRVVVLTPRSRDHRTSTLVVVPLSTTAPRIVRPHHYQLQGMYQFLTQTEAVWAKGDMVVHVALARLSPVIDKGRVVRASVSAIDLLGIRTAVLHAIGLGDACEELDGSGIL